jgi:hypothetical protein
MPEAGRPYPTLGPHFSVDGPDKLFSSPLATCRASWLRVRTRVATVTRLEAMYSHPIDGPINIASFRSGNPRPRLDLRLRSLNRNKGLDRGQLAVSVIERYTAFRALQDPLAQDWTAKIFAVHVVAFSRRKLPGIARRSRRTFAKATAKCRGKFFLCARKARPDTWGYACTAPCRRLSCRLPPRFRHPGSGSFRRQSRPLRCRGVHRHSHPSGNAGPRRSG